MTDNKLLWLRGPLPPLSESIQQSGLISSMQLPKNNYQKFQFPPKIKQKNAKTSRDKVISSLNREPVINTVKPRAKSRVIPFPSINPENFATYKPPPIESQIGGVNKQVQHFELPTSYKPQNPLKNDIQRLNSSLDETIRSLLPQSSLNIDEKFDFTMKLVRVYNYTMNELILMDKQVCSDRAFLLRRINMFYQEVINDIPSYFNVYKEMIAQLNNQITSLAESLSIFQQKSATTEEKVEELQKKIESLNKEKMDLVKESNDIDIERQSMDEKNGMQENQIVNLKYKLVTAAKEIETVNNDLKKAHEENTNQLVILEGYIQQLREKDERENQIKGLMKKADARTKEVEEINSQLNHKIYLMENKELFDACVDTSDLKATLKMKRRKKKEEEPIQNDCGIKKIIRFVDKGIQNVKTFSSAEVQTKDIKIVEDVVEEEKHEQVEKELEPATKPAEMEENFNKTTFNIDSISFKSVADYKLDEDAISDLPNIFEMLVPFFGMTYKSAMYNKLDKLDIGKMSGVINQNKPLAWGLQLIHNFLTDPFIRSYDAEQSTTPETLFYDWMNTVYKVPHLVNQNCGNISILIYSKRDEDEFLNLFADIMECNFTYTQLCFLSLIYTFSVKFTYPSLTDIIQDIDLAVGHQKVLIHAKAAYHVLAKSLSPSIAANFMEDKIDPRNPMWDYIDFLKRAMEFFAEKHSQIYGRSQAILYLCEQTESNSNICYNVFNRFMALLDHTDNHQGWYDAILAERKKKTILPGDLIKICADRRKPLLEILRLNSIERNVSKFRNFSEPLKVFYWNFLKRYAVTIPAVIESLPTSITEKIGKYIELVKHDLLDVDLHALLWHYRVLLAIIDKDMLRIVQEIPFQQNAEESVLNDIIDFFDMAEKVSFSLIIPN